jgi:hypothetical protein
MFDARERKVRSRVDLVLGLCIENVSRTMIENRLKKNVGNARFIGGQSDEGMWMKVCFQ